MFNCMNGLFIVVVLFATGCASNMAVKPKIPVDILVANNIQINHNLFDTQDIDVISEHDLFHLTPEQQQEFLRFYQESLALNEKPHTIILDYLKGFLHQFTYYGETYTASQTMMLKQGNCMSLAVLSAAFAKLVDVEFDFREVITMPIYEQKNNVLLTSSHVQTRLYDPTFIIDPKTNYLFRPGVTIDYFPNDKNIRGKLFSFNKFIAMYYQNMAADALVENDLNKAFAHVYAAYKYDQQSEKVLNLLAVLHRRKGDSDTAEKIYLAAINHQMDDISLMSNYAVLLEKERRFDEANKVKNELTKLNDPNPYSWLAQAHLYKVRGEYVPAIKAYKKVIDLAPYVNEAYVGLYQSYASVGRMTDAKTTLKKGLEWAYEPSARQSIKYKLYGQKALSLKGATEL